MNLTAIMTKGEFAGVVPSDQVEAIVAQAGLTDYEAIENVMVADKAPAGAEIVYEAKWNELIDALNGTSGKVVYK